jgi:Amt family ammonium transporter
VDSLVNSGDTAWMLFCSALVFLLVPGFVLFYGGLTRQKNMAPLLTRTLLAVCLLSLQWVLIGYSLSFGPDHGGWIGNLAWAGLRDVGSDPNMAYSSSIPQLAFMLFQGMIALIPVTLLIGATAQHMKLSAYILFCLLWSTLVYDPVAHWFWGVNGFLRSSGVIDFAGGAVLYLNVGVTALVLANRLGKNAPRSEDSQSDTIPAYAAIGALLIWLGTFGLAGGNALSAGGLAANAVVMTQIAAAVGGITWAVLDRILRKHLAPLGVVTGVVTGLIAITPCAGFVNIGGAIFCSLGAAVICYVSIAILKVKFGYDDSIKVFGLQGMAGIWGILTAGLWATQSVNANSVNGLFYGNPAQLMIQVKATLATIIYSFLVSWGLLKLVAILIGLNPLPPDDKVNIS